MRRAHCGARHALLSRRFLRPAAASALRQQLAKRKGSTLRAVLEEGLAVPWPCAHEFIAIVTHPKIYKVPTPLELALQALAELNACPTLEFIGEADGYLDSLNLLSERDDFRF